MHLYEYGLFRFRPVGALSPLELARRRVCEQIVAGGRQGTTWPVRHPSLLLPLSRRRTSRLMIAAVRLCRSPRVFSAARAVRLSTVGSRPAIPREGQFHEHVQFHEQVDFDWEDLRKREEHRLSETSDTATEVSDESQLEAWERHHQRHANAPLPFFRERRYLAHQFVRRPRLEPPPCRPTPSLASRVRAPP